MGSRQITSLLSASGTLLTSPGSYPPALTGWPGSGRSSPSLRPVLSSATSTRTRTWWRWHWLNPVARTTALERSYPTTATSPWSLSTPICGDRMSAANCCRDFTIGHPKEAEAGGTVFGTQPVVTIQDAAGNTVTSSSASVTLSITTPAGATLTCTTNPRSASSGVATFTGCKIDRTGTYTLTAAAGGLTSALSTSLTITTGTASKLAFTTSPSNTTHNVVFATQPVVTVQDAGGNTVTSSTSITLSITSGGATLTCTQNPTNASSGVATFAGCRISTAGTFTLTASASEGLTAALSNSLIIS